MKRPVTTATKGRPATKPPTDREIVQTLAERVATPHERSEAARERRYQAERDLLVAVLSRLWPSHIASAGQHQLVWTDVVCIHSPAGQLAWGLPVDRAHLFAHLDRDESCVWDRHGASERAARLRRLLTLPTLQPVAEPPVAEPSATPRRRKRAAR